MVDRFNYARLGGVRRDEAHKYHEQAYRRTQNQKNSSHIRRRQHFRRSTQQG